MPANSIALEICVETASGLATCVAAGVDRVELCAALDLGGLTPSPGFIHWSAAQPIPCHAMIRPRPGDFTYSRQDIGIMEQDIRQCRAAGLAGVVFGAARSAQLDEDALARLITAAAGMKTTLHRAIDTLPDPLAALDVAVGLGFDRVLTSGGSASLATGHDTVLALHRHAAGRIEVAAGGGLTPALAVSLRSGGLQSFHASCKTAPAPDPDPMGFGTARIVEPDPTRIAALRSALAQPQAHPPIH